jgi:hypothetical protein
MASLVSGISVSNGTLITPAILNANPTLTAGTVVPSDLSTGHPTWDTSGNVTLSANADLIVGNPANGQSGSALRTGNSSPVAVRQEFGTDGSGWQYRIAKNQSGTVTDLMVVSDTGNVSIGTGATTPAYDFEVGKTSTASTVCFHGTVGDTQFDGTGATIRFTRGSTNYIVADSAGGNLQIKAANSLVLVTGSTNALSIDSTGAMNANSNPITASPTTAKAWVQFGISGTKVGTPYNVSTVTRTAQGVYTIAFSSALSDAYPAVSALASVASSTGLSGSTVPCVAVTSTSTTGVALNINANNGVSYDRNIVCMTVFGN